MLLYYEQMLLCYRFCNITLSVLFIRNKITLSIRTSPIE